MSKRKQRRTKRQAFALLPDLHLSSPVPRSRTPEFVLSIGDQLATNGLVRYAAIRRLARAELDNKRKERQ